MQTDRLLKARKEARKAVTSSQLVSTVTCCSHRFAQRSDLNCCTILHGIHIGKWCTQTLILYRESQHFIKTFATLWCQLYGEACCCYYNEIAYCNDHTREEGLCILLFWMFYISSASAAFCRNTWRFINLLIIIIIFYARE